MNFEDYNDVTVKMVGYVITCKGILRSDGDSAAFAMDEDGALLTKTGGGTLETSGGSCRNVRTGEARIFPAGIYRLSHRLGIERIGEIPVDA